MEKSLTEVRQVEMFTLTLTISLKGEGIAELCNSYPENPLIL